MDLRPRDGDVDERRARRWSEASMSLQCTGCSSQHLGRAPGQQGWQELLLQKFMKVQAGRRMMKGVCGGEALPDTGVDCAAKA